MKSMTCKQLGGACDEVFSANTFEEIAEMSKQHGTKKFHEKDPPHLEAMQKMMDLMQDPEKMQKWFMDKKREFDALPSE